MSRRVHNKSRGAAVITYVGDVVRPTYATDLDRLTDFKIVDERLCPELLKEKDIPYDSEAATLRKNVSPYLVTSSTDETDIQLQLDGATRHMYHTLKRGGEEYTKKYKAHNVYAPLCLMPHRVMPIVLQGWIECHEDGEFRKEQDFDLTYEEFQSNNFCTGKPGRNGSNTTCRYRMTVETVNYRGKPAFGPSRTLEDRPEPDARETAMRDKISAMTSQSAKQIQRNAANSGYDDEQLRNIRTMFNNPNFDQGQHEFYEWHAANPMRWRTGLPLFLQLSPQARENPQFQNLNNELGIQFPHTATATGTQETMFYGRRRGYTVYGFNAKDFIAADSNLFFAEQNGWTAPKPIALVNAIPAKEDEHTEDEDGMLEPEPEYDDQDARRERAWTDSVARQIEIYSLARYGSRTESGKAEKRKKRQEWRAKNKRQPTATELAEEGAVVRTALFPAQFADRVNYLDPEGVQQVQAGTITDRQRADLLLDFVCAYPQ